MLQRPFGPLGQVPVIGQGTWELEQGPVDDHVRALRRGLDLGLTHIDTAELYGSGRVEELVGRALAGRRHEAFLVSKVLPDHATYAGTRQSCAQSLRRLGTDHLDLYLLHWPGPHPLAETVRALESLVQEGKIRAWGVSNFDLAELDELATLVSPDRIACNQVLYHLGARDIELTVLPWCAARAIPVVAYSPFGSGAFPDPKSPAGRLLARLAAHRGASPRQLALRFLTRHAGVWAIPKAARLAHVEDNARAFDFTWSEQDSAALAAAFPAPKAPGPLPVI